MARMVFGTPESTARAHLMPSRRLMNDGTGGSLGAGGGLSGKRWRSLSVPLLAPDEVAGEGPDAAAGEEPDAAAREEGETVGGEPAAGGLASVAPLNTTRAITLAKTTPARNVTTRTNRPRRGSDRPAVLFAEP